MGAKLLAHKSVPFAFPKGHRLLKRHEFKRVSCHGERLFSRFCCLHYNMSKYDPSRYPRIGITVSRKYGIAVQRNSFKRQVREIFRHHGEDLPLGIDINIRPILKHDQMKLSQLAQDLKEAFKKLSSKQAH